MRQQGPFKRLRKAKATGPVLVFFLLIGALAVSLQYAERPPLLERISPDIGNPGDVLVLYGSHFGEDRQGSLVIIAGRRPNSSSYLEWTDERISVQIPDDVGSGLVYVITGRGESKGILFTNRKQIPVALSEETRPGVPYVAAVEPAKGPVGTLVTISGRNFGFTRGTGHVYFTGVSSAADVTETGEAKTVHVSGSETDFDYEAWNEQTIRVRVPDGATSGTLVVSNERGESNTVYFEVTDMPGTRILGAKRGFQIFYSVELRNVVGQEGGSLNLWVPNVVHSPHQRNIDYVKIPEPLWDDFLGVSRYQFVNLSPETVYLINLTSWFDRYVVETSVQASRVPAAYDTTRRLYREYTQPTELIPSADEGIREAASSASRRERNPYMKARAVYLYLLSSLSYTAQPEGETILDQYRAAQGDSYTYAMLFTAFSRSIGIPARPVAGYLVSPGSRPVIHYWAEFYIEHFGWHPVDLALADGMVYRNLPSVESPEEYYFGSLDAQRVAFSRGVIPIQALDPRAHRTMRSGLYSLQTIHEEASPELSSYETVWRDIQVFDIW